MPPAFRAWGHSALGVVAREPGDNERTRRAQGPCWPRGLLPAVGEGQVAGAGWRWGFPGRSRAGYPDYPAAANAFFFQGRSGQIPTVRDALTGCLSGDPTATGRTHGGRVGQGGQALRSAPW